jgi:hypothetical protein
MSQRLQTCFICKQPRATDKLPLLWETDAECNLLTKREIMTQNSIEIEARISRLESDMNASTQAMKRKFDEQIEHFKRVLNDHDRTGEVMAHLTQVQLGLATSLNLIVEKLQTLIQFLSMYVASENHGPNVEEYVKTLLVMGQECDNMRLGVTFVNYETGDRHTLAPEDLTPDKFNEVSKGLVPAGLRKPSTMPNRNRTKTGHRRDD